MTSQYETVLIQQNPHWNGHYFAHDFVRSHDMKAISYLKLEEIHIVTGIRRSGKSTLLETLINQLSKEYDPKSILFINFDDPNYTNVYIDSSLIYSIVTAAETITQIPVQFLFLDEIQNVVAWEKYVKSVYDSKRFKKILVTGSNAKLLNSHYAKLLSGRYLKTHIYPLSFCELIQNENMGDYHQLLQKKGFAINQMDTLFRYGGFPRIHSISNNAHRLELLKLYYETILLKDCIANYEIRNHEGFMQLAFYLISNVATQYSYNNLSKMIQSNENTVSNFIQIFQDAYIFYEIKSFSYSIQKQVRYKKKIYCVDNGLINAVAFQFSENFGKLFENLVYNELKKFFQTEIYFFNDDQECDFIIQNNRSLIAIQACYRLTPENFDREVNGLKKAMKQLSIQKGYIITYDAEEKISNNIHVVPFWKYFSGLIT